MILKKNWWDRFAEKVLRRPNEKQLRECIAEGVPLPTLMDRGPIDEKANDKALVDVRDDHPVYKAVMDYAFVEAGGYLERACDLTSPREARLDALSAFTGIRDFIGNVEVTRAKLQEKRAKAQAREAALEEARQRKKQQ